MPFDLALTIDIRRHKRRKKARQVGLDLRTGDALAVLRTMPSDSVNCVVCSPPYFGLRDYGTGRWFGGDPACDHRKVSPEAVARARSLSTLDGADANCGRALEGYGGLCKRCGARRVDQQIGLESTWQEYIDRLVAVFCEIRRVLADDGTLWIVIGDSYARGGMGLPGSPDPGAKRKDLLGIPGKLAEALKLAGWYWRAVNIWAKTSCKPESVKDRSTQSHEYVLMFAKSESYYYDRDAIATPIKASTRLRNRYASHDFMGPSLRASPSNTSTHRRYVPPGTFDHIDLANARSVWEIPLQLVKIGKHYATFPEELARRCIAAGCRPGGVMLDPFMGSGTTGVVARRMGMRFLGIDLSEKYVHVARERIARG